jgi:hypothetical protein
MRGCMGKQADILANRGVSFSWNFVLSRLKVFLELSRILFLKRNLKRGCYSSLLPRIQKLVTGAVGAMP